MLKAATEDTLGTMLRAPCPCPVSVPLSVPCSSPREEGVGTGDRSRMGSGWGCQGQTLLRAAQHPKPPQARGRAQAMVLGTCLGSPALGTVSPGNSQIIPGGAQPLWSRLFLLSLSSK